MKIEIQGLNMIYPNGNHALKDINLEFGTGMFGLLGPNGAGKSHGKEPVIKQLPGQQLLKNQVWLVRIVLIFVITFLIMLVFTFLSSVLIVKFRFVNMTAQVMVPVLFLGIMAFMLSTVVRNGNGTAVLMIIFGLFFMILSDFLRKSQWNVFLNPYELPYDVNESTWALIALKNRIILITGSIIFLLVALFNLQKREKFM